MSVEVRDLAKAEIEFLDEKVTELSLENAQLHKFLEEFNALEVARENQQFKELLLKIRNRQSLIREYLSDCKLGNAWDLLYQTENEIDNALGEKK